MDLFDFAGKKALVCVDRWSGYPLCQRLHTTTRESISNVLSGWFNLLGWPRSIMSDGGPQFSGEHFLPYVSKTILSVSSHPLIILDPMV